MSSIDIAATELRPASERDLDQILKLLRECKLPTAGVSGFVREFIVAETGGSMTGVIGLEPYGDYALLRSAAVSNDARGKGVGQMLVNRIIENARTRRMRAMYLLTTTAEGYFPAFGFEKVERSSVPAELSASEELRGACPDSATVMRLDLTSGQTTSVKTS